MQTYQTWPRGLLSFLWLRGKTPTVRAESDQLSDRPVFNTMVSQIICVMIMSVHALRLISQTGKRVWWYLLQAVTVSTYDSLAIYGTTKMSIWFQFFFTSCILLGQANTFHILHPTYTEIKLYNAANRMQTLIIYAHIITKSEASKNTYHRYHQNCVQRDQWKTSCCPVPLHMYICTQIHKNTHLRSLININTLSIG